MRKLSLTSQLIFLILLIIGIIFISLVIILPRELLPIYEQNIYNKLKEPLFFINNTEDINNDNGITEADIAYIYQFDDTIFTSYNIDNVILSYSSNIIRYMNSNYGKLIYKSRTYYYYKRHINSHQDIISITNDTYINKLKADVLYTILIVTGISFTLSSLIIILWSNNLVSNIIILKKKIKNIDNYEYDIKLNHIFLDEIYSLNDSIEQMKTYLKNNELYKNQTYQNISHDFKTPIAVIKSYIEATEDGIETKEKSLEIIKEQITILENKVHSLLYLNKLNYLKDNKENLNSDTNISSVIKMSVKKFKIIRSDLNFELDLDSKLVFRGTSEMWETIIDNILNNFMRYAKKEIKIVAKNKKIILFNDGEKIDPKIINNVFTPYKKGINGMFGFGLSIVRKTLQVLNYNIEIENVKNGVNFIIK